MPLSPAQTGQWLAQQLDPAVPMSVAQYVDIGEGPGRLDVDLLSRAGSRAAREFGSGLIRLVLIDSRPHQILDPRLDTGTRIIDLRGEPDPEAAAHTWMRTDVTAPLDLLRDRLSVSVLLRIADDRWFWYTRAHHIALDGVGAATMLYRVADLYNAAVEGREPPSAGPPISMPSMPRIRRTSVPSAGGPTATTGRSGRRGCPKGAVSRRGPRRHGHSGVMSVVSSRPTPQRLSTRPRTGTA